MNFLFTTRLLVDIGVGVSHNMSDDILLILCTGFCVIASLMDSGILVTLKLRGMLFWTASTTWWSLPGNISEHQMETRGKSDVV